MLTSCINCFILCGWHFFISTLCCFVNKYILWLTSCCSQHYCYFRLCFYFLSYFDGSVYWNSHWIDLSVFWSLFVVLLSFWKEKQEPRWHVFSVWKEHKSLEEPKLATFASIWGKCKLQTLPHSGKPHCQPHEHPIHDRSTVARIQRKQNYWVQILLSKLTNVYKMKTGFCIPWIWIFLDSACVFYWSCQNFH